MSKVKDNIITALKVGGTLLILFAVGFFVSEVPKSTLIDFSSVRKKLSTVGLAKPESDALASETEPLEQIQIRDKFVNESRARQYVESAITDYYQGSYEDALRRLDRARIYDPTNYSIFKLSGQIFFEKCKFRRAFNDWERANQLPNDDTTISRDLDVLKRLIRYSRTEIDRLQRAINKDPDNRLAKARLKELEEQMRE